MSDIRYEFPPLVSLAFLGVLYWPVLGPAVLLFGAIGWFAKPLPMAMRYAAWVAAGLCAAPFALLLAMFAAGGVRQAHDAAADRARHRTLATAEAVGTLILPAGAELAFSDAAHRTLVSVNLPRPEPVAGIPLEGALQPIGQREWDGTLARDQVIGGWPCRAGDLWFTPKGVVTRCTLAEDHRLAGYDLPAGSDSRRDPATGVWEFQLPQEGRAMRIAALSADLPAGGTLVLAADGAIHRLYVPHESQIAIAGVALYDHVILDRTGLTGLLAKPAPVAGAVLPADTVVHVDLATGKTEATTRSSIIDP
jgi:hypothetical protein